MNLECTSESFLEAVKKHEMKVLADFGNVRSLHFQEPGTRNCYFQITTWPEHLCISGDMGTYVFSCCSDMFEFFWSDDLAINTDYWHEKLVADSRFEPACKYSPDEFRAEVEQVFDDWAEDCGQSEEVQTSVWEEIEDQVLGASEFECEARHAVEDFHSEYEFSFSDFWETSLQEYTYHFEWCLFAIVWGIQQYDKLKSMED
jgi:hypothetical protein